MRQITLVSLIILLLFSCSDESKQITSQLKNNDILEQAGDAAVLPPTVDEKEFNLYAVYDSKGFFKLKWQPVKWSHSWKGFKVKKRLVSESAWKDINRGFMPFNSQLPESWDSYDSLVNEREKLRLYISDAIKEGRLAIYSNEQLNKKMSSDTGFLQAVWIEALADNNIARFVGLSCVDRDIKSEESYNYALFGIDQNGHEVQLKSIQVQAKAESFPQESIFMSFLNKPDKLLVKCELPEKLKEKYAIKGVKILKSVDETDNFIPVRKEVLINPRPFNSFYLYACSDAKVVDGRKYRYKVELVNIFNETIQTKSNHKIYKSESEIPYFPTPPAFVDIKQTSKTSVSFFWAFEAADLKNIESFYIAEVIKNIEKQISPKLNPSELKMDLVQKNLEYPHINNKKYPDGFKYSLKLDLADGSERIFRVVAVDKRGQKRIGVFHESFVVNNSRFVDAPSGLKRELKLNEDGSLRVHVSWDQDKPKNAKGWILKVGPIGDTYQVNAGAPIIENSWDFNIPNNKTSQLYDIQLHYLVEGNFLSEAAVKKVYCPNTFFPSVNLRRYYQNEDGSITWTWKYPKEVKDLVGFRIFRDGELIADEKTIDAEVREWKTDDFKDGVKHLYQIQAVGQLAITSELSAVKKTYIKNK